jgi:hypothetical protein
MAGNEYIEISDSLMTEEEQVLYANLRGRYDQALAELKKIQKREAELEKKREKYPDYGSSIDPENEGDDALLKQMKYTHAIEEQLEDFKLMVYKPTTQDYNLVPEEAQIIESYRSMRKAKLQARRCQDRFDLKGRSDCSLEARETRNEIVKLIQRALTRHPNSWGD